MSTALVLLRHAPAADAVLASATLCGILPPVTIDGHALINGGLVDNTPISAAADRGVDSIIVLPTGYASTFTDRRPFAPNTRSSRLTAQLSSAPRRSAPRRRNAMTSFATDIRPLFRDKDIKSMKSMFDLSRYEDVKDNADGILETVESGSMPCDQTWSPEQVSTLKAWISEGFPE